MKKGTEKKAVNAVTIIGGADGPTSVFLAGKTGKKDRNPLRRMRRGRERERMEKRRAQVIKKLVANPHTLDELVEYITKKYYAKELAPDDSRVQENWKNMKISLVWKEQKEKMEEYGYPPPETKAPKDIHDQTALIQFQNYMEEYDLIAAGFPDFLVPMEHHVYEIRTGAGAQLTVQMEKIRGLLNVGFTAPKEGMRHARAIMRDIYRYYGVSQEDIESSTDRYLTLVTILAEVPRRKKRRKGNSGNHRKKERTVA